MRGISVDACSVMDSIGKGRINIGGIVTELTASPTGHYLCVTANGE